MRIVLSDRHGLNRVEDKIKQRLAQQLFVCLDDDRFDLDDYLDFLFLNVVSQGAGDFVDDGAEIRRRAPDFARARVIDKFV